MSAKYACITRYRREHAIALMCRVLEVGRASYYAAQHRAPSAHAVRDAVLTHTIRRVHDASACRYGAPRVHRTLQQQGEAVSGKRVARLMRAAQLAGRRPARWIRTTEASGRPPLAPNHLARCFAPLAHAPNRAWVADLTYLPSRTGFVYLAVVLDLASRRVVGWAVNTTLATTLPLAALRQALLTRRPTPGLVHHSDQGRQYTSDAYQAVLAQHGMVPSLSGRGNCYDNAVAESFFATLKIEGAFPVFDSLRTARSALFDFIEVWYNRQRLHSALGYQSPTHYEQQDEHRRAHPARVA